MDGLGGPRRFTQGIVTTQGADSYPSAATPSLPPPWSTAREWVTSSIGHLPQPAALWTIRFAASLPSLQCEVLGSEYLMEGLDVIWSLCEVLGADYQEKLDLLGIGAGGEDDMSLEERQKTQEMVSRMIEIMQNAKQGRFSKIQTLASKLIDLWTYHNKEAVKVLTFPEVFVIVDAANADEINQPKFLSMTTKKKMEEELALLETAKDEQLKQKYLMKKDKFVNLVLKSHLQLCDFDFNPQKKVEPKDFKTETKVIKAKIKLVKAQALIRKDLVLRMELIQHCVAENLDVGKIQELIKVARRHLDKFLLSQGSFMFEGQDLSVYLDKLQADTDERQVQEILDAVFKKKESVDASKQDKGLSAFSS